MRNSNRNSVSLLGAALAWALLVLVGYYYVHKPVAPLQAVSLGRSLLDILLVAALSGLAGGIGRQLLPAQGLTPLERLSIQAALGWGALGLVWLAVGLLGLYYPIAAWGFLLAGWAIFRRDCLAWFKDLGAIKELWTTANRFGKTLAIGSGLLAVGQLLLALSPPTRWDALMYHLELPRRYLAAGQFEFIPFNPYWGNPQLVEMLYGWAMALRGFETATVLGWFFMALFLVGMWGSLAQRFDPTAGWVGVTALLVGPSLRGLMSWGYADGLAALFGYAALVCTLTWVENRDPIWLPWTGIFAGFSLFTKLTAGILLPVLALLIVLEASPSLRQKWRLVLATILPAALVFLPWLLVNAVFTGNPFFPHLWTTPWTDPLRLSYFAGQPSIPGWQVLWLPLAVTWFGVEGASLPGVQTYGTDIGPLLIMLAVPGVLAGWRLLAGRIATIWLFGGWILMVLAGWYSPLLWQTRLHLVLIPAAMLAAGLGWNYLEGVVVYGVRLQRLLAVLIILVLGLNLGQDALLMARFNPPAVVFGSESGAAYLDRVMGWYPVAMRDLESLPGTSKTLFLWEPRGLYAPLNVQPDTWIDRWYLDRRTIGEPQEILERWQDQGFTHLLLYKDGADFERQHRHELTQDDWAALDNLLAQLPGPVKHVGVYQLYSLNP